MYRIHLINMPFASPRLPSIALTQLQSVIRKAHGERVVIDVLYLNLEFVGYLGRELYEELASVQASNAGLGDWIFRQIAFPHEADNWEEYFARHFPNSATDPKMARRLQTILGRRASLQRFLRRLITKLRLDRADLVGFTSMFSQTVASIAMAQVLKSKNPSIVTVLGGANCEFPMGRELARRVEPIDFVFSGPGLVSFPAFVGHQLDGTAERCHEIPGVFSRENAEERTGGPETIGAELPLEVPVPLDYEPFLGELDRHSPQGSIAPSLTFETSRGCWWGERSHCTFCGLNGSTMAYRSMPPDMAVGFMNELFERYGDRCKHFESVDNILPREYLTKVLPFLEAPPDCVIFYEVKADLKEHEMETLAKARIVHIQPGIESLATSTLRLMQKGTTTFHNLAFLKHCLTYGIEPGWNLLIGFPGEGEEVYAKYLEDIPSLRHLPPPSGAFSVRFDRYSPYFTQADAYELDLSPFDFYRHIYPFPEETLGRIAYYFEDRNYNAEYLSHVATWRQRLQDAVDGWKGRWRGEERAVLAVRRGAAGGGTVTDSRLGKAERIELGPLALAIHDALYLKGWRIAQLAKQVKACEDEVAEEVGRLRELGLLFEENERYMSVMVDEDRQARLG